MTNSNQAFYEQITALIENFRSTRNWNHRQQKTNGLITNWHHSRLLTLQASYMLLSRAATARQKLHGIVPPSWLDVGRNDKALLESLAKWVNDSAYRELFDVYRDARDTALLVYFVGSLVEYFDMGAELARRLEGKRFTLEIIRGHAEWGGEDRVNVLPRLFRSYKTRSFTPGLRRRALKDSMLEPADLDQDNWVRALEMFAETPRAPAVPQRALTWGAWFTLQPNEQAFFDGPIATSWMASLPKVLADLTPQLTGQTEDIPRRLRYAAEAAVERTERRLHWMYPLTDPDATTGQHDDGADKDQDRTDPSQD